MSLVRPSQVRRATERLFMEVVPDFVREMKVRLFGENFALTVHFFSAHGRAPHYLTRLHSSALCRTTRSL
jgi:hypothetical protein